MQKYLNNLQFLKVDEMKSRIDHRDYICTAIIPQDTTLPTKFSWEDKIIHVIDQKTKGICTGCASAGIKNIQEKIDNSLPDNKGFSPLYIYALAKTRDGLPPGTEGSTIVAVAQVLYGLGALPENQLPISTYVDNNIYPNVTEKQIEMAMPYKIKSYSRVPDNNIDTLKRAIIQNPVSVGGIITSSFMYPEENKYIGKMNGSIYGAHNFLIIGYDDQKTYTYKNGATEKGFVQILNSWSEQWGDKGKAWISYSALYEKTEEGQPFCFEMWHFEDDHSNKKNPLYYRVQVGAFSEKTNCEKLVVKLKEQGFNTYVVEKDGWFKIQLGAFSIEQNGRNYLQEVKNKGYKDAFLTYY